MMARNTELKSSAAAPSKPATTVTVWEDDPGSGVQPTGGQHISVPTPDLAKTPLPLSIKGKMPPANNYQLDTPEFRYWTAAAAGRRGVDFWGSILPNGTKWQSNVGSQLTLRLDEGEDFNAYYDRTGLSFFHGTAGGKTVYSGESPDVANHELGHAILDAIRPQLWDAANFEVPAFHESFGDMSAILTALQVPSLRSAVLKDTQGVLSRNSRLSRLAEQLGWAIRQDYPTAVDSDCLRNAVNEFVYRDPSTLPDNAPAAVLSREAHSFSRVFTGAFFEGLGGVLKAIAGKKQPTEANLLKASQDMAHILVAAIVQTPIVPNYFSQVAAHMVAVAAAQTGSPYRDALKSAFVRHGILSLQAAATVTAPQVESVKATIAPVAAPAELPTTRISVAEYGLGIDTILVHVASEPKRFEVAGAALQSGSTASPAHDEAARDYLEHLMRRGLLELGPLGATAMAVNHPSTNKTHALVREGNDVYLRRLRIDCSLHSGE